MERLGGSSKDISTLFVYSSIDNYLVKAGRLGFVITQTVFKNPAADEFRNFSFIRGNNSVHFKVKSVHDMVDVDPFESASNRTSTFTAIKGQTTKYPIDYIKWGRTTSENMSDISLKDVNKITLRDRLVAYPADLEKPNSRWITVSEKLRMGLSKISGESKYRARLGVKCDMNGVYVVDILEPKLSNDNTLIVKNLPHTGRKSVPQKIGRVHKDFIYPLISGRNVQRWKATSDGFWIIPHTERTGMKAVDELIMRKKDYSTTYEFLRQFRDILSVRPIYKKWGNDQPFYAVFDIGPYTFSEYKVVWREQIKDFAAAVLDKKTFPIIGQKMIIPTHKLMIVTVSSRDESLFLAGVLNSSPVRCYINNMIVETQIGTDILSFINIPSFDSKNSIHKRISEISDKCHTAVENGDTETLAELENQIDKTAAQLWGITDEELKAIQDALKQMKRSKRKGKIKSE